LKPGPGAALVPVVSDFLFADADVCRQLSHLNAVHDIFLLMADVPSYEVPQVSDGWVEVFDIESGRRGAVATRSAGRPASENGRTRSWLARRRSGRRAWD
jgi:hypothetical protein